MNKDPLKIMKTLEKALWKEKKPVSISKLSRKTKLAHKTVKKYLRMVDLAKTEFPDFELVESDKVTIVKKLDIERLPERERIRMVRQEYPRPSEAMIFLKNLYDKRAISRKTAIPLESSNLLEKMISQERVKRVNRKFYLTELGKILVEGSLRFYPELSGS